MSEDATLDEFIEDIDRQNTDRVAPPTELTGIPDDWLAIPLDEISEDNEGAFVDGPFGSNLKADEMHDEGYARVIQLQNIRSSEFVDTNHKYISEEKFEELQRHGAEPGDLAIAKMSEPVARACLLPDIEEQYIVVADCIKLTVDESEYNSLYMMLALNTNPVWKQAFARSRGSTRKRINLTQLKEVQIPTPPLSEQRRIATVLDNVDQAIQKTESVIGHYEDLQTGLLRKHFGKSSVQVDYPEKRVDKRLGPKTYAVPEDWEIVQVANIGEVVTGDTPSTKNQDYYSGDLPFVTPEDFGDTKRVHRGSRRLTDEGRQKARPIPEGAVMMDCIGMDMGKVRIAGREIATNQQINSVIVNIEEMLPEFLYFHLKAISNLIQSQAGQTRTPIVSKSQFSSFEIFNPPISTQRDVVNSLNVFDDLIEKESEYATQLRRLKRGLMQDLLSGTVRTTDTNIEVPDEIVQHG